MVDDENREIRAAYSFGAPAEVVFGTLTDPERTSRWLPRDMVAEYEQPALVRIRAGERTGVFRVSTSAEELRVDWSAVVGAGLFGGFAVRDDSGGGSTVEVHVRLPAEVSDLDRVRELMDEGARHLRRDLEDNFNAG